MLHVSTEPLTRRPSALATAPEGATDERRHFRLLAWSAYLSALVDFDAFSARAANAAQVNADPSGGAKATGPDAAPKSQESPPGGAASEVEDAGPANVENPDASLTPQESASAEAAAIQAATGAAGVSSATAAKSHGASAAVNATPQGEAQLSTPPDGGADIGGSKIGALGSLAPSIDLLPDGPLLKIGIDIGLPPALGELVANVAGAASEAVSGALGAVAQTASSLVDAAGDALDGVAEAAANVLGGAVGSGGVLTLLGGAAPPGAFALAGAYSDYDLALRDAPGAVLDALDPESKTDDGGAGGQGSADADGAFQDVPALAEITPLVNDADFAIRGLGDGLAA